MTPDLTSINSANDALGDVEPRSDSGLRNSLTKQILDLFYVYVFQFCVTVVLTSWPSVWVLSRAVTITKSCKSGSRSVLMIFENGAIFQVLKSIILFVAVKVINLVPRRAWTNERFHDQVVNKSLSSSLVSARENDEQVAPSVILWFTNAVYSRPRAVSYISNPSKIRNLVDVFKPNDWLPLLGTHGPIIPLQR
jgi:hypothetical protein